MFFNNKPNNQPKSSGNGQIKLVIRYDYNGKHEQIIDTFPANAYHDWSIIRKYLEKKLGTFHFSLNSVTEY